MDRTVKVKLTRGTTFVGRVEREDAKSITIIANAQRLTFRKAYARVFATFEGNR